MSVEPLWTSGAMAAAMRAAVRGSLPEVISGLSIDSRTVAPGEAYFAIKGDVHDGHAFVDAALKAGAALAVVETAQAASFAADAPLLVVDDVLAALVDLAHAARARLKGQVIAVTGSVGKTSTKEALLHVLGAQGKTHASTASFNNHWGVPLSLARCPADAKFAIAEVGMNHAGEIRALVRMVRPHVAVITTIEPAHLGFFSSVEAIADAKAEIFRGVERGGAAILNRDNPHYARLAKAAQDCGIARIIGFGTQSEAAVRLVRYELRDSGSTVTAAVMGEVIDYTIGIAGKHWIMNSLAVLAAVRAAGGDAKAAAAAMASLAPLAGRGERHRVAIAGGSFTLLDESYNASPASMRAAFAVLGSTQPEAGGRRIAVLGDMLELGAESPRLHASLAQSLVEAGTDLVFTLGDEMRALDDALPGARRGGHADSVGALASLLGERLRTGDVVTVKGSHGSKLYELVAALLAAPSAKPGPATSKAGA